MGSLNGRLARLQRLAAESTPDEERIIANQRHWCRLAVVTSLMDRAHEQGRCEDLRYHYAPYDHAPDWVYDAHIKYAWLMAAYDSGPGTPDWKPRTIQPGFYGAADPDPARLEAALDEWIARFGLPDHPIDWREMIGKHYDERYTT
jgi:hypothetical protein